MWMVPRENVVQFDSYGEHGEPGTWIGGFLKHDVHWQLALRAVNVDVDSIYHESPMYFFGDRDLKAATEWAEQRINEIRDKFPSIK